MSSLRDPYPDSTSLVAAGQIQIGLFKVFDTKERKDLINNNFKALVNKLNGFFDLPEYANDAAAGAGGLTSGDWYRTATGEARVKL